MMAGRRMTNRVPAKVCGCVLMGDALGAADKGVAAARAAYVAFSKKAESGFDEMMRKPLLLPTEQEKLLTGLRKEGFFETFRYDPQNAVWIANG